MAIRINLPQLGNLGIASASFTALGTTTGTATTAQSLALSSIYGITGTRNTDLADAVYDYTLTLPHNNLSAGDEIIVKRIGTATAQISDEDADGGNINIEGTQQTIEITDNTPVRLMYSGTAAVGWILV